MKIHLIAVGRKMPDWINNGYQEFAKRLKQEISLHLIEVDAAQRQKNGSVERYKAIEQERIRQAMPQDNYLVLLDENGKQHDSKGLSQRLQHLLHNGRDISLVIGGADGLSDELTAVADETWSLSRLTLPHALVRVVVAEQIYRAWSLLHGHPYHRE